MSKEITKRTTPRTQVIYLKYSIGIDISKDKFDTCISIINAAQSVKVVGTRKFANNASGFQAFLRWQKQKCKLSVPVVFVMEATGVYYERLAWHLHRQEAYLSVVLPNKAKKYLQCLGLKSKTDKIDAKGLAQMGAEQKLERWHAPKESIMQLRDITRYRESLQETRTRNCNQLSAYTSGEFIDQAIMGGLEKIIALLDEQIKETERLILEKIESDPELKEGVDRLMEIKGVSTVTVATVLAETNCFTLFNNQRQLVSFSGYDVVENQSGKHIGRTKISKKGNSHIRRILHLPSINVVRFGEPVFVNLYNRVYLRTKIKMKGYVAVQRELLCLMYTLWKKQVKYDRYYYIQS